MDNNKNEKRTGNIITIIGIIVTILGIITNDKKSNSTQVIENNTNENNTNIIMGDGNIILGDNNNIVEDNNDEVEDNNNKDTKKSPTYQPEEEEEEEEAELLPVEQNHTYTISGQVLDTSSNLISGATVIYGNNMEKIVKTDSLGRYCFVFDVEGSTDNTIERELSCVKNGYNKLSTTLRHSNEDKKRNLVITKQ
ncbi:MAG: carboxypeptidase-like regulatory domain-containing protein [Bacteroidales bacterium]